MAGIIAYLAGKAGSNLAARYVASFDQLYDRLTDHPGSGAPRLALGPHVRIGIVPPYIVIYEHDPANDTVIILRIVHGRCKISGALLLANIGAL